MFYLESLRIKKKRKNIISTVYWEFYRL